MTSVGAQGVHRDRTSIGDVARLAGVSPITVSRVANGSDQVRPLTRDRVLAAMNKLGYAPNRAARALRSGNFASIGVVIHRLDRTGESRTVEGLVEAARAEGYSISLVDVDIPSDAQLTAAALRLEHQAIDGLVIVRAEPASPGTLVLPPGLPVVVSDSRLIGRHPAVASDQVHGTRAAVEHLLDLGHTTVLHIAGPLDSTPANIREETWRSTLLEAGREVPAVLRGDWSLRSGYEQGQAVADDPRVTAVMCANDEIAAGLLLALHERGLRVPTDVSVTGFDDIPFAEYVWPPLTTIRQDFTRIGAELVHMLLDQIRNGVDLTGRHVTVPTELVVRASTAPPTARG